MKREVEFWHFYTKRFFIGVNRFSNTNQEMSVLIKREESSDRVYMRYQGLTMTSKNAVTPRDQKPADLKSSLDSGLVTALLRLNHSLSRGCSCGSTSTLVQTSPISEVSILRTPSCLCATNPPFLHDRAWQTVYFSPQTHLLGKSDRGIFYLKRRESLNSCLFSTKP